MTLLTKAEILGAEDLAFEDVDVPEWGGTVRVQSMTGKDRDSFESTIIVMVGPPGNQQSQQDRVNMRAKLCAACIVDADGSLLFTVQDIEALGRKSAKGLQRVFDVAQSINGFTKADIEELEENSEPVQSDS